MDVVFWSAADEEKTWGKICLDGIYIYPSSNNCFTGTYSFSTTPSHILKSFLLSKIIPSASSLLLTVHFVSGDPTFLPFSMAAQVLTKNTTLGSLGSKSQGELLDVIDELRSQGLSNLDISPPQIVVCGDQSSGKSSVLEALSQVKFPTKDDLCTRFATEVILRKKETESISVSIDPGKSRSPEEHDKLLNFKPTASSL